MSNNVIIFCRCGERATVYRIVESDQDMSFRAIAKCHGFRREIEVSNKAWFSEHEKVGYLIRSFGAHRCDEASNLLVARGFRRWKYEPDDRGPAVDLLLDAGWEHREATAAFDELLKWSDVSASLDKLRDEAKR